MKISRDNYQDFETNNQKEFNKLESDKNAKIFILDWDDTIFPTSYLKMLEVDHKAIFSEQQTLDDIPAYLKEELGSLEDRLLDFFDYLTDENINIFVVSNATNRWVHNCLGYYMPELDEFFKVNCLKIYSAKVLFSTKLPKEKWKSKCFKKLMLDNFSDKRTSVKIVVIGDSNEEKMASLGLMGLDFYDNISVKFLQLMNIPDINTLKKQFEYIFENMEKILLSKHFYHKLKITPDKKILHNPTNSFIFM